MLSAVWAQDKNGVIGLNGTLPWHMPADLKFFKETTINHTIVMGRTTFEGMGRRILPNRHTIVLTRDQDYKSPGAQIMHDIQEVVEYAAHKSEPVYVIGGAVVFKDLLPYFDQLVCTRIDGEFEGDTFFNDVNWDEWKLVKSIEGTVDENNVYPHRFETYERV